MDKTDRVKELKRQTEEARKSWRLAQDKASDIGRAAQRAASEDLAVAELGRVYKEAEKRVEELAAEGRPALLDGWKWDEYGRACDLYDTTVCVSSGDLEIEDDECKTFSVPVEVVRAVLDDAEQAHRDPGVQ